MSSITNDSITENVDAPTYAPSLPVPNVQEMVKNDPLHVPERYVRNQEDGPLMNDMSHLSSEIPVIHLALLSAGDIEELKKLDLACKEWGFFQVQKKEAYHRTIAYRYHLCINFNNASSFAGCESWSGQRSFAEYEECCLCIF